MKKGEKTPDNLIGIIVKIFVLELVLDSKAFMDF